MIVDEAIFSDRSEPHVVILYFFRDLLATRNNAARRLQEIYRTRRENREKHEEETTVFSPALKRVYTGHRNTRTMV